MSRVAIVTYYAAPEGAIASHRVLRLSRVLLEAGHEVLWVTVKRDQAILYDPSLAALTPEAIRRIELCGPSIIARAACRTNWEKVQRTVATYLPRWLALPDGHMRWTIEVRRQLPGIVRREKIDTLFLCCGPHGQIGSLPRIRRLCPDVSVLVDYRDLLSGNIWNEGASERRKRIILRRERKALAAADHLFVNTDSARDRFRDIVGMEGLPVTVMRNAADYGMADEILAAGDAPDFGPGIHIGYFGTIFAKRRLRPILEAIARLSPEQRARLVFHHYGEPYGTRFLREDADAVGNGVGDCIRYHEFSPYGDTLRSMHAMDALVLVNGTTSDDRIFVPGKLFDYLMAGRPTFFVGGDGDASRIVAETSGEAWCSHHSDLDRRTLTLARLFEGRPADIATNGAFGTRHTFKPLLDLLG